jgi:hypothetical protein
MAKTRELLAQVVGLGPAGLGIAVAAERLGILPQLIDSGIRWLDPAPGGSIGDYQILSNSPWEDYGKGLEGVFLREFRKLGTHEGQVLLPLVGKLCRSMSGHLESRGLVLRERVAEVRMTSDGRFLSFSKEGKKLAVSRKLVLACGGEERFRPSFAGFGMQLLDSGGILRGDFKPLGRWKHLHIVGGSHGAAAVLYKLRLSRPSCRFTIWHRGPVRLFYASEAEARKAGYVFNQGDVCPLTGRVHRFGGVRPPYRELFAAAKAGELPNVEFQPVSGFLQLRSVEGAVIRAIGFQAHRLPIRSCSGEEIGPLLQSDGTLHADPGCRVRDLSGEVIPGCFALGLGHQPPPSPEWGGEPNYRGPIDGVNVYFGPVGERVLRGILE